MWITGIDFFCEVDGQEEFEGEAVEKIKKLTSAEIQLAGHLATAQAEGRRLAVEIQSVLGRQTRHLKGAGRGRSQPGGAAREAGPRLCPRRPREL